MFNVEFWSFTKAPNSTAQPTSTSTVFKCVSNEDFNIIEPRVPLQLGPASNPTSYNYAKISVFSRYYWVTRWAFEGGMWVAYMRVDALASWKSQIGGMSAYVLRSAAAWNGDIIDNMYPFESETVFEEQSVALSGYTLNPTQGTYIVGIAGDGPISYYGFTYDGVRWLFRYVVSSSYAADVQGAWGWVDPDAVAKVNGPQYLISAVWIPYTLYNNSTLFDTAPSKIRVGPASIDNGAGDVPNSAGKPLKQFYWERTAQHIRHHHPDSSTRGYWLDAGAAVYTINAPGFGLISLDPSFVASAVRIETRKKIDLMTGSAILDVVSVTTTTPPGPEYMLSRTNGSVGIPLQISNLIKSGVGVSDILSNIIPFAAAVATENYGMAALVAAGAIKSLTEKAVPRANVMGGPASVARLVGNEIMYYQWLIPVDDDLADRGRPLCEKRTLSTLSGYQLCANVEVQIPCTRDEEQMIKGFLESGYFYE